MAPIKRGPGPGGAIMALTIMAALAGFAAAAQAGERSGEPASARAGWLLARAEGAASLQGGGGAPQSDVGGVRRAADAQAAGAGGRSKTVPLLMSLVMPGAGEAYLGHKRGYLMMAVDVASWIGVKSYHDKGNQKRDEYYAFADAHWSEARLAAAFSAIDPDAPGTYYFGVTNHTELPLWVSLEDDRREYYENLGKWEQFIFGWEDFTDPRFFTDLGPDYTSQDLRDPRISPLRQQYRALREESNRQFTKRDRLVYFNMATRLFSLFQVAYLEGLLGGGPAPLKVAGHPVQLIAEPAGWTSSRIGLSVAY